MWPNPQFPADLVTFTEEIFNEKHYFCAVNTPENQSFSDDFSGYKMGKLAKNKVILSLDETIYSISENYILGLSKDVL